MPVSATDSCPLLRHQFPVPPEADAMISALSTLPRFLALESAGADSASDAGWSFYTADPIASVDRQELHYGEDPFEIPRCWQALALNLWEQTAGEPLPPFSGGIAGLLSYELGHAFEKFPRPSYRGADLPDMSIGLYSWCVAVHRPSGSAELITRGLPPGEAGKLPGRIADSTTNARQRQEQILDLLQAPRSKGPSPDPPQREPRRTDQSDPLPGIHRITDTSAEWLSTFSQTDYCRTVSRIIDYIVAGDIFQANLSQTLQLHWPTGAADLFRRLRSHNPAPFSGLYRHPRFSVISASPERFLKVTDHRRVETKPIKGTRRRLRQPLADLYSSDELRDSEKDRAENIMIVDLLRNDLSRVCQPGSVRVTKVCDVEIFATVRHLVSTVIGTLRDDADMWDLLRAAFPGGSITGAPKIRAMEIISELEPLARGAFCGSLFYLSSNGQFDSSILIRTATLVNETLLLPVGGGIVADSEPVAEYTETLHKASGVLRAMRDEK